jgi:mannose-6-phosphate isomerase-like protein (cupin superfamily)
MAQVIDFAVGEEPWTGLGDGEVRIVPLIEGGGVRARLLITRAGHWPVHTEKRSEAYVVLMGEVIYANGEGEIKVRPGQAIVFERGEEHSARIERGAVSIKLDFMRPQ